MTDQTPTPVPTPEPKSGWNTLSQNAKIGVILGAIFALILVFAVAGGGSTNTTPSTTQDTTPTTVSASDQWNAWKSTFQPVVSQVQADYTQTTADLTNGDVTAVTTDFATLAHDGNELNSLANSPDTTVNLYVQSVANDLQQIASTGIAALSSSDLSAFTNACNAFGADSTSLATAVGNDNSLYA